MSNRIMGTYDLEKKVEDTLILLETTTKNYGDPNRAVNIENAILQFVQSKLNLDSTDRFALMIFGEETKTLLDFKDWSLESLTNQLYENIDILGDRAFLIDAISEGFQVLANSMMQLFEGKLFRMLIVTEGGIFDREGQPDWRDLVNKSEKIGLYIDIVEITQFKHDNYLKSIASGTHGEYIRCSETEVEAYISSLGVKKNKTSSNETEADKNMKAFLDIIAQPLDSMAEKVQTPNDLLKFVNMQDESTKCAICHSDSCMICKGPSYACGAFCPNCGRFFHEHCFSAWAENSKDTPPSIGKCPICFALLKVPGAMYRVKVLRNRLLGKFDPPEEKFSAEKMMANELGARGAQINCTWCRNFFNPEEEIFKCGNPLCETFYHINCFEQLINHTNNRCRRCDTLQGRRLDAHPGLQRIV